MLDLLSQQRLSLLHHYASPKNHIANNLSPQPMPSLLHNPLVEDLHNTFMPYHASAGAGVSSSA